MAASVCIFIRSAPRHSGGALGIRDLTMGDDKIIPIRPPEIIAKVGGLVDETGVCLAIYGPDLEPDELTARIGVEPTSAHRRGGRPRPESKKAYDAGAWLLKERGTAPTGPE
jgi:hypothetical protein